MDIWKKYKLKFLLVVAVVIALVGIKNIKSTNSKPIFMINGMTFAVMNKLDQNDSKLIYYLGEKVGFIEKEVYDIPPQNDGEGYKCPIDTTIYTVDLTKLQANDEYSYALIVEYSGNYQLARLYFHEEINDEELQKVLDRFNDTFVN